MPKPKTFDGVDPKAATTLVEKFRPVVRAVIRALYPRVPDQAMLVSAGDLAVVIALRDHDPSRAKLETWVRRSIYYALIEAANQPPIADVQFDPVEPKLRNGADPEEQFWRATATNAVSKLDARQATIVIARMQGETYEEIAESLGISTQRAGAVGKQALDELKAILEAP